MDEMRYDEGSSNTGISASSENLSGEEKLSLFLDQLIILSKKYGLGEVKYWYYPYLYGNKDFSIKISPDINADELIDILYKIEDELKDFAIRNNMEIFFRRFFIRILTNILLDLN